MTHIEELNKLREQLISDIKLFMSDKGLACIKFKQPFVCLVPDGDGISEFVSKWITSDGEFTGTDLTGDYTTWMLADNDLIELAHTLDQLEAENYTVEDEIYMDENDQIGS